MVKRVAIIGAGNVATHLATALHRAGTEVRAVAAAHKSSAEHLASLVEAPLATDDVAALPADVDLVLIAVSDAAVADVAARLPRTNAVVAHTSGSVPLEQIAAYHPRAAVLYPLQTFSRDVAVDIAQVPIFTEATDSDTLAAIDAAARQISRVVYHADSKRRAQLHIAGVLSSNFTVYLLEQCRRVLEPAGFPLEVVHPLAEATLAKAFSVGPHDAMTGPARRGDLDVVEKQASSLSEPMASIYRVVSQQIYNAYNEHN